MHQTRQIADSLWIVNGPTVRWFTMPFPTRMIIVRLSNGSLFVHSPIELTTEVQKVVESLGVPRYLVSPNKLHHLFWAQWQGVYKDALSFSPPGLRRKRPDLTFHADLGDRPHPAWAQDVDQVVFHGSWLFDEVVFFHKPSRTAIFGDLIENFDPQSLSRLHRVVARLGRVLASHGQTPLDFRLSFILRHNEANQSLRKLLDWEPEVVVMCHGIPVQEHAASFIESAFAWLGAGDPTKVPSRRAKASMVRHRYCSL